MCEREKLSPNLQNPHKATSGSAIPVFVKWNGRWRHDHCGFNNMVNETSNENVSVKFESKNLNLRLTSDLHVLLLCVYTQSTYIHTRIHSHVLIKLISVYLQTIWVIINTHTPGALKDTKIAMHHPYDVVTQSFGSIIGQTSQTDFSWFCFTIWA